MAVWPHFLHAEAEEGGSEHTRDGQSAGHSMQDSCWNGHVLDANCVTMGIISIP